MTKAIQLGKNTFIDPMKLIEGRMLIVGNSGSGKSYLSRVLCEGIVDVIPTLVLDREGEFATLREHHDVALIGEGGEADTSVATAAKLARMLVELGVSAVINLYDLSKPDKRKFVRLFLDSLLNLPRSLWRPMLVLLDEAHEFCPEAGREAESRESVIRLMDQGRKRGIGGILATQRFAKLAKDAAGEANNVCIGRIVQDVDLRRASDTLGFAGKSEWPTLRELDPGEWFAFGPGFSHKGIGRFTCLRAKTTHPKAGQRHKLTAPAPSRAILKVAPDLKALKAAVIAEQDELTRLRAENKELRSKRAVAAPRGVNVIDPAPHVLEGRQDALRMFEPALFAVDSARTAVLDALQTATIAAKQALDGSQREIATAKRILGSKVAKAKLHPNDRARLQQVTEQIRERVAVPGATSRATRAASSGPGDPSLGRGQLRQLMIALAQHPEGVDRVQLAMYAGASIQSSHYGNNLSTMRVKGWMEDRDRGFFITDAGLSALGSYDPLPEGKALVSHWLDFCGGGAKRRMLQALLDAGKEGLSRQELAEASEMSITSSHYGNVLSELRGAKLAEGKTVIRATQTLLDANES